MVEPGASSIFAPGPAPWSGVFGDFLLCASGGEIAYLDSVDYEFDVAPAAPPQALIRVLEPDDNTTATAVGTLAELSSGPRKLPGTFHPLKGFEIANDCEEDDPAARNELLLGFEAGTEGVRVRYATLNYRDTDDEPHRVRIPWQMIMCGSETDSSSEAYCD